MKKLLILRGVPGSGKSYYAKTRLVEYCQSSQICSADNYFIRPDGYYDFNPRVLKKAHAWCRKEVELSMDSEMDAEWRGDVDLIIVDNTNTRHWEYEAYIKLAVKYNYGVEVNTIGEFDKESVQKYAERNSHGVPVDKVHEMADRFEF